MIKVDQGTTTMLYGYLLYYECVIVMDACDGARSALTSLCLQLHGIQTYSGGD